MKQISIEKCLIYGDRHSDVYNELIISGTNLLLLPLLFLYLIIIDLHEVLT